MFVLILTASPLFAQQFIGCRTDSGWAEIPRLRTTFNVDHGELRRSDFETVSFWVSVVSLGYHEVYVNGTKVGDRVLQPAVSQPDKRALNVRYDISDLVHEGDNEIMLWLGQGWGRVYGTPAVAQAWVKKSVSDGECGLVYTLALSDSTWEASPSPYSYTGSWQPMQFGGERYDARIRERWRPATVWSAGCQPAVTQQEFDGNRIVDTVPFRSFEWEPDGSLVIDFGRVVTGWFAAVFVPFNNKAGDDEEVYMPEGTEVTMEYLDHRDARPPFTETDVHVSDGIGIWFYQALAGIRPDPEAPGYRHFFIDPQLVAGIDWVSATKPTQYGTIVVEIKDGKLTVEVPSGTTATLFPGTPQEHLLAEGHYEIDF